VRANSAAFATAQREVVLPRPTGEQQPGLPGARCSSIAHAPANGPRPKAART